ncbi:MAG: Phosphorylated carbohydrates phosphatase [Firmicutes bacterium ADurb.Bin193]|nr:MAG: Phosphorylated carbohydrates phosphatase [Firmicutes bacterium ADurb.Bin193]
MNIKGAIFDLDGTLLDSMHIWHAIDRSFLEESGVKVPDNLSEMLKKKTIEQCVEYFISELGVAQSKKQVMKRLNELMRDVYLTRIELKPFAHRMLDRLKEKGIMLCVATANDYDLTCDALKHLGVLQMFLFVTTCGLLNCSKTEPKIYNYCAERLGLKPDEVLVFEDALHAAVVAKEAGFRVVGVYDRSSEAQKERMKEVCDLYIHSFDEDIPLL